MSTQPRANLLELLEDAYNLLDRSMIGRLNDAGFPEIRSTHGQVFGAISPDGSRVGEMAKRASITQQSMSELVDQLEELGYVERIADPSDRRARIIRLTRRGRRAVRVAQAAVDDLEREWATAVGDRRMKGLRAALEIVTT